MSAGEKTTVERYYSDPSVTLWLGDAGRVLKGLPAGSVDCMVTSPPYYGLRDYGVEGQIGLEGTIHEYVARLVGVFHEAARVLKDDGTLWLNLGDSYARSTRGRSGDGLRHDHSGRQGTDRGSQAGRLTPPCKEGRRKSLLGIPWRVAFALMDDGWILRNDIIWRKRNAMPTSATDRMAIKHEDLFLLARSEHYYFDLDAIKVPATVQSRSARTWNRRVSEPDRPGQAYSQHRRGRDHDVTDRPMANPGDVWDITNKHFSEGHFATFPEELPATCIKAGCRPGGVVMDPFSGSGTTGMAALKEGRRYVGIDVNREYLDLSLRTRLAARPQGKEAS